MKINMQEFNNHLAELSDVDVAVRRKAASQLVDYSGPDWHDNPDAVTAAVAAIVKGSPVPTVKCPDPAIRALAAKVLGSIGPESPAVLPELLRLLAEDTDASVRTEAARALGKIGERAAAASRVIVAVLGDPRAGDGPRSAAAWALARVAPQAPGTAAALGAAANDRSGHVGVSAAEALWKASGEPGRAVVALIARLGDPAYRHAAVQALYRIGPDAKEALPALLVAAKTKDRLFQESVVMAVRKIASDTTAKAGPK